MKRLVATLGFSIATIGPPMAEASQFPIGEPVSVGSWFVSAQPDDQGAFLYCSADLIYGDDTMLNVIINRGHQFILFASNPAWQLPASGNYDGTISVGATARRDVTFVVHTTGFWANLNDDTEVFAAMQRGSVVTFSAIGNDLPFQIGGTNQPAAFRALLECVEEYVPS